MKNIVPFIPITGGPGAGKTTIIAFVIQKLMDRGVTSFILPESATLLNEGMNIAFSTPSFQKEVVDTHLFFYKQLERLARDKDRSVVLCDRGLLDSLAYTTRDSLQVLLPKPIDYLRDTMYKAVVHLQTAAIDAEEFYTTANNTARKETPAEARLLDDKVLKAWNGHPKHCVIANKGITFDEKKDQTLEAILNILGVPVPVEDEEKYLIDGSFDLAVIPPEINVVASPITQDYLINQNGEAGTERVRKRGNRGSEVYFHTIKRSIPDSTANIEEEEMITKAQYWHFLERKDPQKATVQKTRYTFHYNNVYFELDIFKENPYDDRRLILLEAERTIRGMKIVLPDFIMRYFKGNVTSDKKYSNANIAKALMVVH